MPKPEAQKIPVTLVTGFLGAGKTTLLNHILRQKGNKRVAVIENEVGEINIDNSLVVENLLSKEDLVSMDRGCVCCSLRNDIVGALRELQSRATQRGVTYDAILLETTGLADPAPVAFTFFANSWLSANYRLDSILCLVDAEHLREHLEDAGGGDVNEAVNQIAFADIVLLNKIDRVSEETLQLARDMVRSINVTADVVEVALAGGEGGAPRHPPPAWDRLMGINSFSIERALQVDPGFMDSDSDSEAEEQAAEQQQNVAAPPAAEQLAADDAQQNGGEAAGKRGRDSGLAALDEQQQALLQRQPKRRRKKLHDRSGVGSVGITSRGPLDKYRFNMFMRDLLGEKARDIFRSKGVLCIKGQESTKFVFQGVHETICFGPAASNWQAGEEPVNQIVFIGRSLDRRALVEGFRSCVWVELPDGWTEHHDPRTKRPYYVNSATGQKQWERPQLACALVQSTETSHKQPSTLQPRRGQDGNIVAARA